MHGDEGEGTSERPASPGERTYVRTCATRSRSPAKPEALQYTPRVSIGVESFGSLRPGNSTTGWLAVGTLRILKLAQDVPTLRSLHTYEFELPAFLITSLSGLRTQNAGRKGVVGVEVEVEVGAAWLPGQ